MATPASSPSSTEKRATAEVNGVTRAYEGFEKSTGTRRSRMIQASKATSLTREEVQSAPISLLYEGYVRFWERPRGYPNEKIFEELCLRFNCIPSVDLINYIIQKANIVDENYRLNFPVYFFMQYFTFKVCISDETGEPRLLVGHLTREHGEEQVWLGWSGAKTGSRTPITAAKTRLYYASRAQKGVAPLQFNPEVRQYIKWVEPLDELFQMRRFFAWEGCDLTRPVEMQNVILLSVAKVVFRFSGLTELVDCRKRIGRRFPENSKQPFTRFDKFKSRPTPLLPYWRVLDILNFGPSPADKVHACHPPDSKKFARWSKKRKRTESGNDSETDDDADDADDADDDDDSETDDD